MNDLITKIFQETKSDVQVKPRISEVADCIRYILPLNEEGNNTYEDLLESLMVMLFDLNIAYHKKYNEPLLQLYYNFDKDNEAIVMDSGVQRTFRNAIPNMVLSLEIETFIREYMANWNSDEIERKVSNFMSDLNENSYEVDQNTMNLYENQA